ncbi:MAG: hypothetical protein IT365_21190 [Candidatus Hydrogenedentes bacterium]|nr:hypothetical protein [Candidatus Hydrogenedentota bacterium]
MMRYILPKKVRYEILEHLTDAERKELGQIPYVMGFFLAIPNSVHIGLWILFWPEHAGLGFMVLAAVCLLAVSVAFGLLCGYWGQSWLLSTKYGKCLNIQSPELR